MRILQGMMMRKSVREYEFLQIEDELMRRIEKYLDEIEPVYKKSKIRYVMTNYCTGGFAPYYVGIYTDQTKEGQINAGFVLQQLSVYLSAMGIASCFREKNIIFQEENKEGLYMTICLAFGYPKKIMYRNIGEEKRLSMEKICVFKEPAGEEIEKLLQCAVLAPSSYNAQPWRFVVYQDRIHIFIKNNMIRRINRLRYVNIGAMLANVMICSDEAWIEIKVRILRKLQNKSFGNNEYILSVYLIDTDSKKQNECPIGLQKENRD